MNSLAVDPATGFLESSSPDHATFDAQKKVKFIELAQACVEKNQAPKLKEICNVVGINVRTFWNHVEQDHAFKSAWDEIRFQVEDILSQSLVNLGQKANGVGACAFWLKNRVPERWSDNPGVHQNFSDFSWVKKLGDALNSLNKQPVIATEAEVVKPKTIDSGELK